uniref:Ubiquitin-like domain-containing protein n=1 Tax=Gorilla gorilla gorilla TaxID=9595 RepID=A0A2I2ZE99_GORGO
MDVFLVIRRHKTTIFTDAKESSTVFELKRVVEGILKRPPDEQRLYCYFSDFPWILEF